MKTKEKKLANNMSSIVKIDPSNISFDPPFEILCPVLALTKFGSAIPKEVILIPHFNPCKIYTKSIR
jgi:hypothetical protein